MDKTKGRREVRAQPAALCVPDGDGDDLVFEGYAAVFDVWSEDLGGFREQIAPGAFRNTIETDDVRALLNHNPNYVLGRNRSGTMTLSEDERGLRFEIHAPNTNWARDLRESVRRGDINQCSFGFETIEDEWKSQKGLDERTLRNVRLQDVSIVTYPAYDRTSVSARSTREIYQSHLEEKKYTGRNAVLRRKLELKDKEGRGNNHE